MSDIGRAISDIWRAYTLGHITEDQAAAQDSKLRGEDPCVVERGKRIEIRRMWGGSSSLPPFVRKFFTLGQQAVLVVFARECKRTGICDLSNAAIAALAGVRRTVVAETKALARKLGLIDCRERRFNYRSSDTTVIRIKCRRLAEWIRKGPVGEWVRKNADKKNILSRNTLHFWRPATERATKSRGENVAPWDLVPT